MSLKKWGSKKKNLLSRRLKKRYKMLYFVLIYASCPSNPWNFNLVLNCMKVPRKYFGIKLSIVILFNSDRSCATRIEVVPVQIYIAGLAATLDLIYILEATFEPLVLLT